MSDTVFNIKSKEHVGFQSSPPVVFSLFRVPAVGLINKCYEKIAKEIIVFQAVKMFKQMFLYTPLLMRILSIIILIVIPSLLYLLYHYPYSYSIPVIFASEVEYSAEVAAFSSCRLQVEFHFSTFCSYEHL